MTLYSNTGNPIDFPKLSTIDKLWGKALDRVVPDTYSSLSLAQVEKVKTVFAELIVRECIEQGNTLANHYINTHPEQEQVMLLASIADYSNEIKKHFGVEE